jgi:hypothetical protein
MKSVGPILLMVALAIGVFSPSTAQTIKEFSNRSQTHISIANQNGALKAAPSADVDQALKYWKVVPVDADYVMLVDMNGNAMHCQNGTLQVGKAQRNWQSAHWKIMNIMMAPGYVRIRNRRKLAYLVYERGRLELKSTVDMSSQKAMWKPDVRTYIKPELTTSSGNTKANASISSKWKPDHYLMSVAGRALAKASSGKSPTTKWNIKKAEGSFVELENGTGGFLHCENGELQVTWRKAGWHSAQWVLEDVPAVPGYVRIKNRWKGKYLHIENGKLEMGDIQPGWHSAMWKVKENTAKPATKPTTKPSTVDKGVKVKELTNFGGNRDLILCAIGASTTLKVNPAVPYKYWKFIKVDGTPYVKIKNMKSYGFLHVRNGKPETSKVAKEDKSALWKVQQTHMPDVYWITNSVTGHYLYSAGGKVAVGNVGNAPGTSKWKIEDKIYAKPKPKPKPPSPKPKPPTPKPKPPTPAAATAKLDGKHYIRMTNYSFGKEKALGAIGVKTQFATINTKIYSDWSTERNAGQYWKFIPAGNNEYYIVSELFNGSLAISVKNNEELVPFKREQAQRWKLEQEGDYYKISSVSKKNSEYRYLFYSTSKNKFFTTKWGDKTANGKWYLKTIDPDKYVKQRNYIGTSGKKIYDLGGSRPFTAVGGGITGDVDYGPSHVGIGWKDNTPIHLYFQIHPDNSFTITFFYGSGDDKEKYFLSSGFNTLGPFSGSRVDKNPGYANDRKNRFILEETGDKWRIKSLDTGHFMTSFHKGSGMAFKPYDPDEWQSFYIR